MNKFSRSETRANIVFSAISIRKHRVKNAPIWEQDFAFHILKNNKRHVKKSETRRWISSLTTIFVFQSTDKLSFSQFRFRWRLSNFNYKKWKLPWTSAKLLRWEGIFHEKLEQRLVWNDYEMSEMWDLKRKKMTHRSREKRQEMTRTRWSE